MPDLLLELFSEEIPAGMQPRAAADLKRLVTGGLMEAGLIYAGAVAHATPRRLALSVQGLSAQAPERREERRGPRVDAPEAAIEGFLRSAGVAREALRVQEDKKGAVYLAEIVTPGRPAAAIVAEVVEVAVRGFPWPKSMRWGEGSLRWVRPLHSILCILSDEGGAQVVDLEIDGIRAGDVTRGHRFMAGEPFAVTGWDDYVAKLREDRGLLSEIAGLVEWPVVLMGEIGDAFLDLPPEVLQTSMRTHQKFFSVRDQKTGRIVRFVIVANRETADGGAAILAGNGRVLAARLSDAKFFWENDLRLVREKGMEGMAAGLADVTFHAKLGSQAERVERICALARGIAPLVGAAPDLAVEAARLAKADLQSAMVGEFPELQGVMGRYYAQAAGHGDGVPEACEEHYRPLGPGDAVPSAPVSVAVALADKIDTLTGFWAIDEKPTGSKDPYALRRAGLGVIRLVVGNGVRVGLHETISIAAQQHNERRQKEQLARYHRERDKFALIASQVEGILIDPESLDDKIGDLGDDAMLSDMAATDLFWRLRNPELAKEYGDYWNYEFEVGQYQEHAERAVSSKFDRANLLAFLHDRLKVYLREQGIRHDVIDACLAMPGNDDLTLLVKRVEVLAAFLKTDDGENLLLGFRRANNILTQAEEKDGVEYSFGPDPKLADAPE
ncbi:MAG: glycine--tRNA ligase subunit beta, partial [Alphaproteobacteria bacterium HGW-Alphaproteobacteria-2]